MPGFLQDLLTVLAPTPKQTVLPPSRQNSSETLLFASHPAERRQLQKWYVRSGVLTFFVKEDLPERFRVGVNQEAEKCFPNDAGCSSLHLHSLWHSQAINKDTHFHLAKTPENICSSASFDPYLITQAEFDCLVDRLTLQEKSDATYYLTTEEASRAKKQYTHHLNKVEKQRQKALKEAHSPKVDILNSISYGLLSAFAFGLMDYYFQPYLIEKLGRTKALAITNLVKLAISIQLKVTPWWHVSFEFGFDMILNFMLRQLKWDKELETLLKSGLSIAGSSSFLALFKPSQLLTGTAGKVAEEQGKMMALRVTRLLPKFRPEPTARYNATEVVNPPAFSASLKKRA